MHKPVIHKTACIKKHAKKRALERHGVIFSNKDLFAIRDLIQSGNGTFINKQSNTRSLWEVFYLDKTLVVVYDKLRKLPITVLPKNCRESYATSGC